MAKTPRPSSETGVVIGQVLQGKYRVEEFLGQGGMGIVARCTHLALDEQVAIKMLRHDVLSDEDAKARFTREAQAVVKLRSEYVARVSDVGELENGVPYMVMEFLDGHDLGALLDEQHHLPVQWVTELMLQTAEALAEAHSIGIIHRDVKPTNLFVTWRPDGTSLIKVLDFGISKSAMGTDMELTQTQSLLGTPAYMSPEQLRSARLVDARTDLWSLGTVMYELLEGRRPFEADSFSEMCVKVSVDAPLPMINTPPELQQVVLRCLAKAPEQRYANMAELGADLIPFARDPHAAALLVERMARMLGRPSGVNWDAAASGNRLTPVPGRGGYSSPVPGAVVAPLTHREISAPAVAPVDIRKPRSTLWLAIGALVLAGIAIAAVVFVIGRREPAPASEQNAKSSNVTGAAGATANAGSNAPDGSADRAVVEGSTGEPNVGAGNAVAHESAKSEPAAGSATGTVDPAVALPDNDTHGTSKPGKANTSKGKVNVGKRITGKGNTGKSNADKGNAGNDTKETKAVELPKPPQPPTENAPPKPVGGADPFNTPRPKVQAGSGQTRPPSK